MTFSLIPWVALWHFCYVARWRAGRFYRRFRIVAWRLRLRFFGPPHGWQWADLDDQNDNQSWGPLFPGTQA